MIIKTFNIDENRLNDNPIEPLMDIIKDIKIELPEHLHIEVTVYEYDIEKLSDYNFFITFCIIFKGKQTHCSFSLFELSYLPTFNNDNYKLLFTGIEDEDFVENGNELKEKINQFICSDSMKEEIKGIIEHIANNNGYK
jgi:hypothetical protein